MNTSFTDKILCVGLKTSCLGTTAQDREATADVLAKYDAKAGKMRVSKTILADAIKPARQRRAHARKWFNNVTLPGISEDLRITTPARLAEIQTEIARLRDEDWEWLTKKLIPSYEDFKNQDRLDLGSAFDSGLYPPAEDLHQHFNILLTTTDMPQGDFARIQGLTAASQAAMQEQHQKMLVQVGTAARNEVYRKLTELIAHVAAKMSDLDAKKFHESTFTKLDEYLAIVPDLNITNDPVLEQLRKEAKETLSFKMKEVRDCEFLKEQAATAAKDILKRFGNLGAGRKLVA